MNRVAKDDGCRPKPEPHIFWLASYPKSGNTWTRAFIAALRKKPGQSDLHINQLQTGAIASAWEWVEHALGFELSELSQDEIDRLRPYAYRWHSATMVEYSYNKTHDGFSYLANGEPMMPIDATRGALCIVRNPLDVAVSFAHHNGQEIDQAIENMGNPDFGFCKGTDRLYNQLRQKIWSWSEFVDSWWQAPVNKLTVRYEDMKQSPLKAFTQMAEFLRLPSDSESVETALAQCKIDKLQIQEAKEPFKEKSARAESFFRKGIVGDWQQALTEIQIAKIVHDHGKMMRHFGYLDAQGKPVTA